MKLSPPSSLYLRRFCLNESPAHRANMADLDGDKEEAARMREQAAQLPCGGEHNVEWRPDTSSRGPQQLVVFVTRFIPRGEELLGRYYTGAAPKSGAASKARADAAASAAGTAPVPPLPPPTLDAERPALKRARLSPTAAAPSSTPARVLPPPTLHIPAGGSAAVPAPAPPPTPVSPPPPTAAAAVTTSRSFALPGFASSLDAFAGHLREQGRQEATVAETRELVWRFWHVPDEFPDLWFNGAHCIRWREWGRFGSVLSELARDRGASAEAALAQWAEFLKRHPPV